MDRKTKVIRLVAVSLFIEIHKKKKLSIEHCLLAIILPQKETDKHKQETVCFSIAKRKRDECECIAFVLHRPSSRSTTGKRRRRTSLQDFLGHLFLGKCNYSVVTTHYQENALKISLANPLIHDNKISNGFCVCFCGFVCVCWVDIFRCPKMRL